MNRYIRFSLITVILLIVFVFSVFADDFIDFNNALIYEDITFSDDGSFFIYDYVPLVDSEFYRLYVFDSATNFVLLDAVYQCLSFSTDEEGLYIISSLGLNLETEFPLDSFAFVTMESQDVSIFMTNDSSYFDSSSLSFAIFPVSNSSNSSLLSDLGFVGSAVLSNSASLGATIAGNPFLLFTCGFLFIGGCVSVFGRFIRRD